MLSLRRVGKAKEGGLQIGKASKKQTKNTVTVFFEKALCWHALGLLEIIGSGKLMFTVT